MFITARRSADQLTLELTGDWCATDAGTIEAELNAIDLTGARRAQLALGSSNLDISGAWLLHDFLARARTAGVEPRFEGEPPSALRLVERTYSGEIPARVGDEEGLDPERAVADLGRRTVRGWRSFLAGLDFAGRV
jgi:hypothetical protein